MVKTLVGLIDWKLDVQAARGHTVAVVDINSGLQGIVFNGSRGTAPAPFAKAPGKGRWAGGADPRREGTAKGTR